MPMEEEPVGTLDFDMANSAQSSELPSKSSFPIGTQADSSPMVSLATIEEFTTGL